MGIKLRPFWTSVWTGFNFAWAVLVLGRFGHFPPYMWRFGSVGNVVGRNNEVNQLRARLVLGWATVFKTGKPSLYVTSHPGQLSLAIPPRVGKMSTGDDYGYRQGRNGEFCVTVGPVTRTADILTQSIIWQTWAVC